MAHEDIVRLVGLHNVGSLEVVLVKAVHDLLQVRDLLVEPGDVVISGLPAVAVGVERVRPAVLVVGKDAKVLAPVAERRDGVDKGVRARDVWRRREALQQPAVGRVVGVPPHVVVARRVGVDDFGSLDDVLGRYVRVVVDRGQGQAVRFPGRKVVGAVHGHAAAFLLALNLVLAEPPELARLMVNGDAAGVGVDQFAFGIAPLFFMELDWWWWWWW